MLSYLAMTLRGYYNPSIYGLLQGSNNTAIIAPKANFPYEWNPFTDRPVTTYEKIDDNKLLRLRAKYLFYTPLYILDRLLWHKDVKLGLRKDGLSEFNYPVKNFFDYNTLVYKDYKPK